MPLMRHQVLTRHGLRPRRSGKESVGKGCWTPCNSTVSTSTGTAMTGDECEQVSVGRGARCDERDARSKGGVPDRPSYRWALTEAPTLQASTPERSLVLPCPCRVGLMPMSRSLCLAMGLSA